MGGAGRSSTGREGSRRRRRPDRGGPPGFTDLQVIGQGRCSTVFSAREGATGRAVALKVIDAVGLGRHHLESLEREAVALAALGDHPHIVTLYRSLVLEDRRPVLVLELCAGSLARVVGDQGPLGARAAAATGVKLAGALETAHRVGVLHLDVRADNVLVTRYDEPALADFGMARLRPAGATTTTAAGGLAGPAVAHAAPELLLGDEATAATDVYQLAATLYHLLTGQPPFPTFPGERPAAVAHRVLHQAVEPSAAPGVPPDLHDLLLGALSKDPADRPGSMALFADALRAVEVGSGWAPTPAAVPGAHTPWTARSAPLGPAPPVWAPGVRRSALRRIVPARGSAPAGHRPDLAADPAATAAAPDLPPPERPAAPGPPPEPPAAPDLTPPVPAPRAPGSPVPPPPPGPAHLPRSAPPVPAPRAPGGPVPGAPGGPPSPGHATPSGAGGVPDRGAGDAPDRGAGDEPGDDGGAGRRRTATGLQAIDPAAHRPWFRRRQAPR